MLKSLQRKFILTNMVLVGLVLVVVFTFFFVNTYKTQIDEVYRPLRNAARTAESAIIDPYNFNNGFQKPFDRDSKSVTVILDSNGKIVDVTENYATMSKDILNDAIEATVEADTYKGSIKSMHLYFFKLEINGYKIISFGSSLQVERIMQQIFLFSISLILATMFVFFIISLLLAKMAIKPVKRTWEQQQQFVADASHELKTPLTVILANNNILLSHENKSVSDQKQWIESSQDEANHMKKLIDNLLFLAQSDASKSKVTMSQLFLSDIVMDAILQFDPVAFEKGVIINGDVDPDIKILGDNTQIKQLIHILLDNGCKYAGTGGEINVRLKKNSYISLSIQNTGTPIPKDDLPHIFERFYRSDKVRTQQNGEGGYGLGLAIAKTIVDQHKGKISVTSTEAGGTTFTVELK